MSAITPLDIADDLLQDFGLTPAPVKNDLTPNDASLNALLNVCNGSVEETISTITDVMQNSRKESQRLHAAKLLLEVRRLLRGRNADEPAQQIMVVVKDGDVNVQNVLCPPRR